MTAISNREAWKECCFDRKGASQWKEEKVGLRCGGTLLPVHSLVHLRHAALTSLTGILVVGRMIHDKD